jgi:hypothetical protein
MAEEPTRQGDQYGSMIFLFFFVFQVASGERAAGEGGMCTFSSIHINTGCVLMAADSDVM